MFPTNKLIMPSPYTLTGTEEEFKKMFPNLKFGPGENGVTNSNPDVFPVVIPKPSNRKTIQKKRVVDNK